MYVYMCVCECFIYLYWSLFFPDNHNNSVVSTDKAPAAVGPYSQAIKSGSQVFVSGCIALVPGVQSPPTMASQDDVAGQTKQVMANMGAILAEAGSSFDQVIY